MKSHFINTFENSSISFLFYFILNFYSSSIKLFISFTKNTLIICFQTGGANFGNRGGRGGGSGGAKNQRGRGPK